MITAYRKSVLVQLRNTVDGEPGEPYGRYERVKI